MLPNTKVIQFDHVTKQYRQDLGRQNPKALSDLSFCVRQGEVFGIIGPNGAGKSTALKILMGFISYDSGTVTLSGHHPAQPDSHSAVGYLPENPSLYDNLTIIDHLRFAGRVCSMNREEVRKRSEELLEMVDLLHVAKLPIRRYSKGMTQRAALAYALFHEPEILVLDEPLSGLDPLGRQLVVDIIRDYNVKGNTILFCSHILTDVERICTRIAVMDKGKLAATLAPSELASQANTVKKQQGGASPLESYFLSIITKSSDNE